MRRQISDHKNFYEHDFKVKIVAKFALAFILFFFALFIFAICACFIDFILFLRILRLHFFDFMFFLRNLSLRFSIIKNFLFALNFFICAPTSAQHFPLVVGFILCFHPS